MARRSACARRRARRRRDRRAPRAARPTRRRADGDGTPVRSASGRSVSARRATTGSGKTPVSASARMRRASVGVRRHRDQRRVAIGGAGAPPHRPKRCSAVPKRRARRKSAATERRRQAPRAARRRPRRNRRAVDGAGSGQGSLGELGGASAACGRDGCRGAADIGRSPRRTGENKTRTKATPRQASSARCADRRPAARRDSVGVAARRPASARGDGSAATASALSRAQALSIVALQPRREGVAVEAGRDRRQIFDHRDARAAREAAPAPEQPGVERDRQAGRAGVGVERGDAELVARRRAGRPARALGIDDHLPARRQAPAAPGR